MDHDASIERAARRLVAGHGAVLDFRDTELWLVPSPLMGSAGPLTLKVVADRRLPLTLSTFKPVKPVQLVACIYPARIAGELAARLNLLQAVLMAYTQDARPRGDHEAVQDRTTRAPALLEG